jgi:hypothetical protein
MWGMTELVRDPRVDSHCGRRHDASTSRNTAVSTVKCCENSCGSTKFLMKNPKPAKVSNNEMDELKQMFEQKTT